MIFRDWCVNNDIQESELTILNDIVKMNIFGMLTYVMVYRHNQWSIRINNTKWYHEDEYLWYIDISDCMST